MPNKITSTNLKEHSVASHLEYRLVISLMDHGFPEFKTQYKFLPNRQLSLDVAFLPQKVGIEIQGYGAGHNSKKSMMKDAEKNNLLITNGWKMLYFTSEHCDYPRLLEYTLYQIANLLGISDEELKNSPFK